MDEPFLGMDEGWDGQEDPDAYKIKMLVYAGSGWGKTTFLGTAADDARMCPALLLDFEGGLLSIRSKVRRLPTLDRFVDAASKAGKPKGAYLDDFANAIGETPAGKLDALRIVAWDDLQDIMDLMDMGKLPYQALLVDSLTEIGYLNLRTVTRDDFNATGKGDGEFPLLQDYGKSAVKMREIIRGFRDLDVHVIFTALPQEFKDESTSTIEVRPGLTGKLSAEVPGILDIVGYGAISKQAGNADRGEEFVRKLFFQPTNRFLAKDRSEGGKLGLNMENPTLKEVLDRLGIAPPA